MKLVQELEPLPDVSEGVKKLLDFLMERCPTEDLKRRFHSFIGLAIKNLSDFSL